MHYNVDCSPCKIKNKVDVLKKLLTAYNLSIKVDFSGNYKYGFIFRFIQFDSFLISGEFLGKKT